MKKFNKLEIAISIAIVIALPFVFKPDLMTDTLESIFKFVVVTALILLVIFEAWYFFRNK